MKTVFYNQFDGGQASDPRDPRQNLCRVIKHFDNYTDTYKLTPYRSMKVDAVTESTLNAFAIQKFAIANSKIYGVGVVNNGVDQHTQIYIKTTPTDPTAIWTTASGGTSSSSVELFIDAIIYHNNLYGVNTGGVWKYGDITGTPSFTFNEYTTHVPSAKGLVHSKFDILYWPSGNLILQNDLHTGAGWSVGLTLPTNSNVTSICEYGNYLAIACDQADGSSVVYLWDTETSLNDLSEKIDWGNGSLKLIETIGGTLCGISTTSANLTSLQPRVMFKYYDGTKPVTFEEYVCTLITIGTDKQKFNNLFYFLAEITMDSTIYKGLWKIFKNPSGNMAISFDKLPRNDVVLDAGSLKGFIRWGDYTFIAYLDPTNSDAFTIWRTDDQANYTATSIHESTINPQMPLPDRVQKKKLVSIGATYESFPTGGSAVVKYKTDGGSWLKAFTETTAGIIRTEPVTKNTETPQAFFSNFYDLELHIETTGGVQPTSMIYKYEPLETNS